MILEQAVVRSGREDSLQTLLVSDYVGVLRRGDFCWNVQILRGSKVDITRRRGDRSGKFLLRIRLNRPKNEAEFWFRL